MTVSPMATTAVVIVVVGVAEQPRPRVEMRGGWGRLSRSLQHGLHLHRLATHRGGAHR